MNARSLLYLRLCCALGFGLATALGTSASAVILDGTNQCTVKLSDGTDVVLFGEFISSMQGSGGGSRLGRFFGRGTEPAEAPEQLVPFDRVRRVGVYDPKLYPKVTTRDAAQARQDQNQALTDQETSFKNQINDSKNAVDAYKDFKPHQQSNNYYYLPP